MILYIIVNLLCQTGLLKALGFQFTQNKARFTLAGIVLIASFISTLIVENSIYLISVLFLATPISILILFEDISISFLIFFCLSMYSIKEFGINCISLIIPEIVENTLTDMCVVVLMTMLIIVCMSIGKSKLNDKNFINMIKSSKPYYFYIFSVLLVLVPFEFHVSDGRAELVEYLEFMYCIKNAMLGMALVAMSLMFIYVKYQSCVLKQLDNINKAHIQLQKDQYIELNNKQRDIQSFMHDYNAHITAINSLADTSDNVRLKEYLSKINLFERYDLDSNCNNIIADSVFSLFKRKCSENNIRYQVIGRFPTDVRVEDPDLCVLLSNLLNNAVDAASNCNKSREVTVEITNYQNHLFLKISNSSEGEIITKNNRMMTTKEDTTNHGFGIRNVENVVKRYNGEITWQFEDGKMICEVDI